jgi:uncharacterized protein (TIGR02246 family)
MSIIARRATIIGSSVGLMLPKAVMAASSASKSVGQKWIDGWNTADPEAFVAAFTADGVYEDVPFGLKKKGSAQLRELHKFFHDSVGGLYVKLIAAHVATARHHRVDVRWWDTTCSRLASRPRSAGCQRVEVG